MPNTILKRPKVDGDVPLGTPLTRMMNRGQMDGSGMGSGLGHRKKRGPEAFRISHSRPNKELISCSKDELIEILDGLK